MKPRGHRRINYNRKKVPAALVNNVADTAGAKSSSTTDENVIEVGEEPITCIEEESSMEDDSDTIAIINDVYGGRDDLNDDFSLDFQDEIINESKLFEFASEE